MKCLLARKFPIAREAHPVDADFVKLARTGNGPGMVGDTHVNRVLPSASFLDLAKVLGTVYKPQYPAGRGHALAQARLGQKCISSSSQSRRALDAFQNAAPLLLCPLPTRGEKTSDDLRTKKSFAKVSATPSYFRQVQSDKKPPKEENSWASGDELLGLSHSGSDMF